MSSYLNHLSNWVSEGKARKNKYLIIIFDNQDKDYYPYYTNNNPLSESKKFISESKLEVIDFVIIK